MKNILNKFWPVMLVLLLSYWAIRPLTTPFFFPMHDDTQPARVYVMAKALTSGQFPVRIVSDLGYGFGYPLFNFYAPLPYYLGGIINLAGFEVIEATKIMFLFGILLSGAAMYWLASEIAGIYGGIVASVFYLYAPYHAVNIYVRGAVGELYAYALLPLIFLGFLKIFNSKGDGSKFKKGIIVGSIGIAGVLLSHNILGMLVGLFIGLGIASYLIYLFIKKQKLNTLYFIIYTVFLGFGLSSFFILPAFFEKGFTKVEGLITGGSDFREHFVYPNQLWDSPWGFAGSAPGLADGMSFKIGKLHLLIGLLSILFTIYFRKRRQINSFLFSTFIVLLIFLIFSLFLMLDASRFLWEILPLFPYIQYPWRFLNLTLLSLSLMAAFLFIPFKRLGKIMIAFLAVFLVIFINAKYFIPREYIFTPLKGYFGENNLRYRVSKISDEYLPKEFVIPQSSEEIAYQGINDSEKIKVSEVSETADKKVYNLTLSEDQKIITNIIFFPGWKATLDGQKIDITNHDGRIELPISAGQHTLELTFTDTPLRKTANIISFLSIILLVYVSLFWEKSLPWKRK